MSDASVTTATALSYAIVALEKLPADWRPEDELTAMRELLERVCPDENFRLQFLSVSRGVLDGNGQPRERPRLV